ncbi:hypothetical protein EVAR_83038_1 [Eumeta japonica]|uniref:Uncharacterized protein n=1 Tax=Eumeta variegata TaxID=151549 RepID=A0A4C1VNC2_EUMVA|nr:hypothetical protein EVAR_83038_1 [Eumeta japonica]
MPAGCGAASRASVSGCDKVAYDHRLYIIYLLLISFGLEPCLPSANDCCYQYVAMSGADDLNRFSSHGVSDLKDCSISAYLEFKRAMQFDFNALLRHH